MGKLCPTQKIALPAAGEAGSLIPTLFSDLALTTGIAVATVVEAAS